MSRSHARLARITVAAATAATVSWLGTGIAAAHVSPVESEVPAGSYTDVQLRVPHGCEESPTTKVEVQIPDSITGASPFWVSGWTASAVEEELETPLDDGHGGEITERTASVAWTAGEGNALPDHQVLDLGISFKAPEEVGEILYFKTIQTCEDGTSEWITEWDGTGDEPDKPAPSVTVVAAAGDAHGGGDAEATTTTTAKGSGDDADDAAATSDDEDANDATPIAAAGLVAGLAGLGLGGAAFAKTRKS